MQHPLPVTNASGYSLCRSRRKSATTCLSGVKYASLISVCVLWESLRRQVADATLGLYLFIDVIYNALCIFCHLSSESFSALGAIGPGKHAVSSL